MRSILLVLLSSILFIGYSQDQEIDNLNRAFKIAKNDTTRCNLLVSIAEYLYISNPDTVIPLSEQTIKLVNQKISKANSREKFSYLKSIKLK